MNDQADNDVDGVAHPVDSRVLQAPSDMSVDEEVKGRRSSLKQEEEDAKGHLGGGDICFHHEKVHSSSSAEGQDPSNIREDETQSKDEDIEGDSPQQGSKKVAEAMLNLKVEAQDLTQTVVFKSDKGKSHLDDVPCPGDGITSSQVNPGMKHSQEKSTKDEHPKRRSSVQQEEENAGGDVHSTEESPPVFGLHIFGAKLCLLALLGLILALLANWILRFESPPVQKEFNLTHVFHEEMDKVQSSFPSQPSELWRRSRIHLRRHLQMTRPTEPVSLLLTSGRGAEKTLTCLAQRLAAAFSTALNASVLDIDGASKTAQDPEQVKLDIDIALKEAFEGGTRSAVIHRFEELPPGSTLIFYRYCDHENAVFKKVFLTFTVLLENLELSPNISLGLVEEMVQEYLKKKFISSDRTAMFNQMDVDKLSGLWSRISHVILPVAPELAIEQRGCRE